LDFVYSHDLVEQVDARITKQSLLIAVGSREGSISWSGGWMRQTTRIAHRHPATPMVIAYPRLERRPETRTALPALSRSSLLQQANYRVGHEAVGLRELVRKNMPPGVSQEPALVHRLVDGVSALGAEVGLVHGTTAGLVRSRLVIVVLSEPITHEQLSIRVLLILLNPMAVDANHHLDNLSVIAKALTQPQRHQALLAATCNDDARQALIGPLPGSEEDLGSGE
jgi:mannitol/fructose-specific phosphotransferase system IIA component